MSAAKDDYLDHRPLLKKLLEETEGVPTINPDRRIKYLSATHISDFRRCPKRCYGARVWGLKSPTTKSQALGTEIHALIEDYGKNCTPIPQDTHAGQCVLAGAHLLPDPARVAAGEVCLELEFIYEVDDPDVPVPYYGLIDVCDMGVARIEDHKSCSSFDYCLSPYELKINPQIVIYGSYSMTSLGVGAVATDGRRSIRARHNYFRTRSPQTQDVETTIFDDDMKRQMALVNEDAKTILRQAQLPFMDVPHNLEACGDYRGCHMANLCVQCGVPVPGKLPSALYADQPLPQEITNMAGLPPALQKLQQARNDALASATPIDALQKQEAGAEAGGLPPPPATSAAPAPAPTPPPTARFGVPKPALTPAPVPRPVMTINPPDGVPRDVTVPPEMPQPAVTATQEEIENRAAAEAEAKKAAKEAQKMAAKADKPAGLPGKKKKEPEAAAVPADVPMFLDGMPDEVIQRAVGASEYQAAVASVKDAEKAHQGLVDLTADVKAEAEKMVAAGQEDEADDFVAEHDKNVRRAERAIKTARDSAATFVASLLQEIFSAIEAEKAQATSIVEPTPAPVVQQQTKVVKQTQGQQTAVRTLYINCRPRKQDVTFFEDFIAPYIKRAEETKKTAHFRLLQHDALTAVVVELLADVRSQKVQLPSALVMLNFGPFTHGVYLESLAPMYDEIVQ